MNYVDFRNLSWDDIQFGIYLPNRGKGQLVNHILILVKYLLFVSRNQNTPPTERGIEIQMEQDRLEEKRLATLRNTLSLHLKKWENCNCN